MCDVAKYHGTWSFHLVSISNVFLKSEKAKTKIIHQNKKLPPFPQGSYRKQVQTEHAGQKLFNTITMMEDWLLWKRIFYHAIKYIMSKDFSQNQATESQEALCSCKAVHKAVKLFVIEPNIHVYWLILSAAAEVGKLGCQMCLPQNLQHPDF